MCPLHSEDIHDNMKNKIYHTPRTVLKSNTKIIKTDTLSLPLAHTHDFSFLT